MEIEYLYSIINLYLKNEDSIHKANLTIYKKEDILEFDLNMNDDNTEKTVFNLNIDDARYAIKDILNIYKGDLIIIDEVYNKEAGQYQIKFKNGRKLVLNGFTVLEINNARNILYDININANEIRLDDINEEKKMPYVPATRLQQAGFTSYSSLFLACLFLLDIFVIALWIFKSLTK